MQEAVDKPRGKTRQGPEGRSGPETLRGGGGGARSPPAGPTSHGHPLGENGDCALSHFLKAQHGGALGAPAVRTHPKEVAGLVGPACCLQHPPVGTQQPSPDMYGYPAAPGSLWTLRPYSFIQNSWLPLLPATDDTPIHTCPPYSPCPSLGYIWIADLSLTNLQSPLRVLQACSSPTVWPKPVSTVYSDLSH